MAGAGGLDGIFYLSGAGYAWRMLSRAFPPWSTVNHSDHQWRLDGTWARLNAVLREHVRQDRQAQPSGCIVDSQSVKTTGVGGARGYDGAKKLSGRKRHSLVDIIGVVLQAVVHRADLQDRAGAPLVLSGIQDEFPHLAQIWVDQDYTGSSRTPSPLRTSKPATATPCPSCNWSAPSPRCSIARSPGASSSRK